MINLLFKGITIADARKPLYILGVIDDYTRLVWLELLSTKQALDAEVCSFMNLIFPALSGKSFNMLRGAYGIEIESLMSESRGLLLAQMLFAFALNENLLFKALANLSDSSHIEGGSKCATGRRACFVRDEYQTYLYKALPAAG